MRRIFFLVVAVTILSSTARAQEGFNGETEIGNNGEKVKFFSQFVNYEGQKFNAVTRYFWVEDVLKRAANRGIKPSEYALKEFVTTLNALVDSGEIKGGALSKLK